MAKNKTQAGRPNIYETKIEPYLKQIAAMREAGISHDDIFPMLGVSRRTYYNHKKNVEEFLHLTRIGDEELVRSGRVSLRKLLDGYTRTTTTYRYKYETIDDKQIEVLDEKIVKEEEIGPEPSSVYFTLVNKTKGEFRHKQDYQLENSEEVESFEETMRRQLAEREEENANV